MCLENETFSNPFFSKCYFQNDGYNCLWIVSKHHFAASQGKFSFKCSIKCSFWPDIMFLVKETFSSLLFYVIAFSKFYFQNGGYSCLWIVSKHHFAASQGKFSFKCNVKCALWPDVMRKSNLDPTGEYDIKGLPL